MDATSDLVVRLEEMMRTFAAAEAERIAAEAERQVAEEARRHSEAQRVQAEDDRNLTELSRRFAHGDRNVAALNHTSIELGHVGEPREVAPDGGDQPISGNRFNLL